MSYSESRRKLTTFSRGWMSRLTDALILDPARRDKMLVEVGGELVNRFGLLFGRNSESVIRLRPVLVPKVGEFFTEPIVVEPGLGTSLVESPMATDDLLWCHRPIVNEPELDGALDCDK